MVAAAVTAAATTMDPAPGGGSPRRCGGIKRKSPFPECVDSKEGSLFNDSGDGVVTAKNDSISCQDEKPREVNDNNDTKNIRIDGNYDCKVGGVSTSAIPTALDFPPSNANAPQAQNKNMDRGSDNGGRSNVLAVVKKRGARDISEYKIIGPIGEGTYGLVWKAVPPSKPNEIVALKMIKTTELNSGGGSAPLSGSSKVHSVV